MDLLMGSSTNSGFDSRGYEYQLPHSVSPITGPSPRAHSVHVESSLLQTQVRPQESMTTEGSRYRDIAVKRRLGVRTLSIFIVGDEAVGDADTPAPLLDKSVKWKRDTKWAICPWTILQPALALFHFLRDLVVLASILRLNLRSTTESSCTKNSLQIPRTHSNCGLGQCGGWSSCDANSFSGKFTETVRIVFWIVPSRWV